MVKHWCCTWNRLNDPYAKDIIILLYFHMDFLRSIFKENLANTQLGIRAVIYRVHCDWNGTLLFKMFAFSYVGEDSNNFISWGVKKTRSLYLGSNSLLNWWLYLASPPPEDLLAFKYLFAITMITFFTKIFP